MGPNDVVASCSLLHVLGLEWLLIHREGLFDFYQHASHLRDSKQLLQPART